MSYSAPHTFVTLELVTAAAMNAIQDNIKETAVAKSTTAGDMTYATGANALARLAIGSAGALLASTGSAPSWKSMAVTVREYGSGTTWSKPSGIWTLHIRLVGPGGGGGGAQCNVGDGAGAGGGAGGFAEAWKAAASLGATETVTVGAGGTAGANTGGNGGSASGNTVSFGSHASAAGGTGGAGKTANSLAAPGSGGAASAGDTFTTGADGFPNSMGPSSAAFSGKGADSRLGRGGGIVQPANAGIDGLRGGGGSGAASNGNAQRAGGVGGAGFIVIEEFTFS